MWHGSNKEISTFPFRPKATKNLRITSMGGRPKESLPTKESLNGAAMMLISSSVKKMAGSPLWVEDCLKAMTGSVLWDPVVTSTKRRRGFKSPQKFSLRVGKHRSVRGEQF